MCLLGLHFLFACRACKQTGLVCAHPLLQSRTFLPSSDLACTFFFLSFFFLLHQSAQCEPGCSHICCNFLKADLNFPRWPILGYSKAEVTQRSLKTCASQSVQFSHLNLSELFWTAQDWIKRPFTPGSRFKISDQTIPGLKTPLVCPSESGEGAAGIKNVNKKLVFTCFFLGNSLDLSLKRSDCFKELYRQLKVERNTL